MDEHPWHDWIPFWGLPNAFIQGGRLSDQIKLGDEIDQKFADFKSDLAARKKAKIDVLPAESKEKIGGPNILVIVGQPEPGTTNLLKVAKERGSVVIDNGDPDEREGTNYAKDWAQLVKQIEDAVKINKGKKFDRIIIVGHGSGTMQNRTGPGIGLGYLKIVPNDNPKVPGLTTTISEPTGRVDLAGLMDHPEAVKAIQGALTPDGVLQFMACGSADKQGQDWYDQLNKIAKLLQRKFRCLQDLLRFTLVRAQ
jgi:hypothetical protein